MALAPFFDRIYSALGAHLSVSRDDLTKALEGITVGIECGSDIRENDRLIADLATNILARLYPRLALTGNDRIGSELRELAVKVNPEIELTTEAPSKLRIGIGGMASTGELLPTASGWVAKLHHSGNHRSGPKNPYAAGAAAALATAELFRRVFLRNEKSEDDVSVSLLNFDETSGSKMELPSSDIGDVLFVGVGAVGNAALWALARDTQRRGHLILVDHEQLELSNLQRYVLAFLENVSEQKVVLGKGAFENSPFSVDTVTQQFEAFAEMKEGIKIPTVCVSVDNIASRRAAQALLPRLVINGWTGDRALGASWHVFSREAACLACLYHPHSEGVSQTEQAARALGLSPDRAALLWVTRLPLSDGDITIAAGKLGVPRDALQRWHGKTLGDLYTDVVCGAVPIDLPVAQRVEVVPLAHQSAMAGILMAAELVKRTSPELAVRSQCEPLVSWDDILRRAPTIWSKPRAREKGCICGDAVYQKIYQEKWNSA